MFFGLLCLSCHPAFCSNVLYQLAVSEESGLWKMTAALAAALSAPFLSTDLTLSTFLPLWVWGVVSDYGSDYPSLVYFTLLVLCYLALA